MCGGEGSADAAPGSLPPCTGASVEAGGTPGADPPPGAGAGSGGGRRGPAGAAQPGNRLPGCGGRHNREKRNVRGKKELLSKILFYLISGKEVLEAGSCARISYALKSRLIT